MVGKHIHSMFPSTAVQFQSLVLLNGSKMRTLLMTPTVFYCHHGRHSTNVAVYPSGFSFLGTSDFTSNVEQKVQEQEYSKQPKKSIDGRKFIC